MDAYVRGRRIDTRPLANRSPEATQTASLIFSVMKSRLISGDRLAVTSTRMVLATANHCGHRKRNAAS